MTISRRSFLLGGPPALAACCVACSRDAALDLRQPFEALQFGDTLEQVRTKLGQPLSTPYAQDEALGFKYTEYRLIDRYSSYRLRFGAAPGMQRMLVVKNATAHVP